MMVELDETELHVLGLALVGFIQELSEDAGKHIEDDPEVVEVNLRYASMGDALLDKLGLGGLRDDRYTIHRDDLS